MKCPECFAALSKADETCHACGWKEEKHGRVRDFLTRDQRSHDIQKDYNENYEELAQINIEKSNVDRTFLRSQARNLNAYTGDCAALRVCEIGVGQGFLCDIVLSQRPARMVGVDVAISFLRNLEDRDGLELVLANAESLPFYREFDLVVSTDVMEHVLNVGSYLYCINRALTLGGRAAIRVPYREGLLNYSPHTGYKHQFGHMRSFNKDILRIYFEQAGFNIQQFHLDGYSPYMPKDGVMDGPIGILLISQLQKYLNKKGAHWSEVNQLPAFVKNLLLRPVEIVVLAEKVKEVSDVE